MALRNAFADLATDDSLKAVKTSVDALKDSQINASQKTKLIDTAGTNVASVSAAGALSVDGSAVTQPISAASLPLPSGASTSANQNTGNTSLSSIDTKLSSQATAARQDTGNTSLSSIDTKLTSQATAAKQPALGTAGTASTEVITIQGIAAMTKLLVTPDSVALPANQSVNVAQINGITPLMGAGNTGTGSPRVTIATDQAAVATTPAGNVASGAADSGNPIKVGGKYNSTPPTLTDGQRGDAQVGTRGSISTTLFAQNSATAIAAVNPQADATTNSTAALAASSLGYVYNGTTWDRVRSDGTTGGQGVGGTVASAATDSGNPVKVGGKYNTTRPTFTDGQRGDLQLTARGDLITQIFGSDDSGPITSAATTDALAAGTRGLSTLGLTSVYNGTTWDRVRSATSANNTTGTGLAGAGTLGVAATALPTAATATNYVTTMADKYGRQVVIPQGMRDIVSPITRLTLTASVAETTLIAAVASVFNDLLSLSVINTSATNCQVDFRDSTAGTIRFTLFVPAFDTRGVVFNVPMPQNAVNNNWTAQCGTSVSSIIITGQSIANR